MDLETNRSTNSILEKWRSLNIAPCEPAFWARGGHQQTLLGHFIPSPSLRVEDSERVDIQLPEGDTLVTHFYRGESETIVYLFHGLGGHSHGTYMMRAAILARKLGHSVLMTNHRGCGAGEGLALEPYHSGRADDLSTVIAHGKKLFPHHRHIAIGFSLSANALLLLASGLGGEPMWKSRGHPTKPATQPDAAITVNAPIDLERCAHLLKTGFSRVYDIKFVRDMQRLLESKRRAGQEIPEFSLGYLSTLHDFDEQYTGAASGFGTREQYYETCSAARYLKHVNIPTFMLTAADDPFIDVSAYREVEISSQVIRRIEPHGGHLGYYNGKPTRLGTKRWLDYVIWELLNAID